MGSVGSMSGIDCDWDTGFDWRFSCVEVILIRRVAGRVGLTMYHVALDGNTVYSNK